MNKNHEANFQNLCSWYSCMGSSSAVELFTYANYTLVKTANSKWPNLAIVKNQNEIEVETIRQIDDQMQSMDMMPLIIAGSNVQDKLKLTGFLPIDRFIGMYSEELGVDDEGESDYKISILEDADINEWVQLVSSSLFNSERIDNIIFRHLQLKGSLLIALKLRSEIVGTSLVYFDEDKRPGVYLVTVKNQYRGRGLATKMIHFCFQEIKRRHMQVCYLQATKMGFPLYLKLGFKTSGDYVYYWKLTRKK